MLTRRRLLAALAGLPGVALVAKLWKPVDSRAPILEALKGQEAYLVYYDEFYTWNGELNPRTVTVAARFGPKDKTIRLRGKCDLRVHDMLYFHKPGVTVPVCVRVEPGLRIFGVAVDETVLPCLRVSGERYTLREGDEGFILGNVSPFRVRGRSATEDALLKERNLLLYGNDFEFVPKGPAL